MIIAHHYHIQNIRQTNTIINHDIACCPSCSRPLVGFGYRKRIYRDWMTLSPSHAASSDPLVLHPGDTLRIRRLFCPDCGQIHHELPAGMIRSNR